jgi:hypothetical protein
MELLKERLQSQEFTHAKRDEDKEEEEEEGGVADSLSSEGVIDDELSEIQAWAAADLDRVGPTAAGKLCTAELSDSDGSDTAGMPGLIHADEIEIECPVVDESITVRSPRELTRSWASSTGKPTKYREHCRAQGSWAHRDNGLPYLNSNGLSLHVNMYRQRNTEDGEIQRAIDLSLADDVNGRGAADDID